MPMVRQPQKVWSNKRTALHVTKLVWAFLLALPHGCGTAQSSFEHAAPLNIVLYLQSLFTYFFLTRSHTYTFMYTYTYYIYITIFCFIRIQLIFFMLSIRIYFKIFSDNKICHCDIECIKTFIIFKKNICWKNWLVKFEII